MACLPRCVLLPLGSRAHRGAKLPCPRRRGLLRHLPAGHSEHVAPVRSPARGSRHRVCDRGPWQRNPRHGRQPACPGRRLGIRRPSDHPLSGRDDRCPSHQASRARALPHLCRTHCLWTHWCPLHGSCANGLRARHCHLLSVCGHHGSDHHWALPPLRPGLTGRARAARSCFCNPTHKTQGVWVRHRRRQ